MGSAHEFERFYAAAREGDPAARAWLVKRFDPELERWIHRKAGRDVRRWNEIGDLRNDVWATFLERLPTYPPDLTEGELKGYLFQLADWRIADAVGKEGRQIAESKASAGEPLAPMPSTGEVTKADDWRNAEETISRLPLDLAAVLRARDLEGKSTAEVARELGIAMPTVKQRLARARSLVERELKRRGKGNAEG